MDINTKISCIGTGAMGGAIIGALAKKYINISVTDKNAAFGKSFAEKNNCTFVEKNTDVIKDSKYIFIAVKPQFLDEVFAEIASKITENQVVISMAAGVKIEKLNT